MQSTSNKQQDSFSMSIALVNLEGAQKIVNERHESIAIFAEFISTYLSLAFDAMGPSTDHDCTTCKG